MRGPKVGELSQNDPITRVSGLTADIRRFSIEKTRIITDARSSRTNLSRESYSVSSIRKEREKNIYSEEEEKALATFTEHRL